MWRWLLDAHRLLGLHLEIIDDRLDVITPSSSANGPLRSLLVSNPGVIALTMPARPRLATVEGLRVSCTPVIAAQAVFGAVLVAIDATDTLSDDELARIGSVLADAMSDQLQRPVPERRGRLHMISALYELLRAGIGDGSETAVLRTFAEALSIWDDVELFAYRSDLSRHYTLEVSLPGSNALTVPHTLQHHAAPNRPAITRLTPLECAHAGLAGAAVAVHLSTAGGAWLVALRATRDVAQADVPALYFAALAHALNAAVAVEASRLTWAVMQQLVGGESPIEGATRALHEVSSVLHAEGRFVVLGPDGSTILAAGRPVGDGLECSPLTSATLLRSPVEAVEPFVAVLEMQASVNRVFTHRDAMLFTSAVANFAMWLPPVLQQTRLGLERRGRASSFDEILDRYTGDAYASNDAVSLILIASRDASASAQTAQAWIRRLRPELRPTDLAGRLRSGEVGILLLQTAHDGAHGVARRLLRLFDPAVEGDDPAIRVGVSTQAGALMTAAGLIEHARRQTIDIPGARG